MSSSRRRSYLSDQDDESQNIVEHFEKVQGRIEELTRQSKLLLSVLKKKLNVDKEHVKALHKMTQSIHEDVGIRQLHFEGVMDGQWSNVREKLNAEAMRVSSVASTLEQQALQPLQVYMLADLDKRFHSLIQDGRKLVRDYFSAKSSLSKTKDKYFNLTSEWEGSLLAIYQEHGDTWNPAPGNKLHEKEVLMCKKMEDGREEYEAAVKQTNTIQSDILGTHLPQILESLRSVAENMVAVMNNSLKCFSEMQNLLIHGHKKTEELSEQFNAAEYCQKVVFKKVRVSSIPPPPSYEFEEYPFKDHTLMVQARKVQYQCMSKLSAKELANRGHQFLANGDKRKSSNLTGSKDKPTVRNSYKSGVNDTLMSLCLEYLHQPLALKEEGLFRVSGDNSIMKALLADFSNGRATKEFLRQAIMSQKDPNNVSGLLKMHLREKHLLSEESADIVRDSIAPGMDGVLGVVLSKLSSIELQLLTDMIELLRTMVQDEWRTQNKMSAHTLGIACGLSLFPQLDPSKATAFTSYLIENYRQLNASHTVL